MGAPYIYIYDISHLRVNFLGRPVHRLRMGLLQSVFRS